ncbi:hypothetical protein EBU99_11940 [bacterium]|nr:hypothetical protein [bacterium]
MIVFLHSFFATTLFAALLADTLFLRSKASVVLQPEALLAGWRRWVGLYEMFAVVLVAGLGLSKWMPLVQSYPAPIFHTKLTLLLVLLGLAKVRMFKERRTGEPALLLTRLMLVVVTLMFLLGLSYHTGV